MALYQVVTERLRLGAHRLSGGSGGAAGPDAKDSEKAKDEKGNIQEIRFPLMRGYVVYTDGSDFENIPEHKQSTAFYAYNQEEIDRFVSLDALEEIDADEIEAPSDDPRSFGLLGEDNGTDNDVAQGIEIRTAEAQAEEDEEDDTQDEEEAPADEPTDDNK